MAPGQRQRCYTMPRRGRRQAPQGSGRASGHFHRISAVLLASSAEPLHFYLAFVGKTLQSFGEADTKISKGYRERTAMGRFVIPKNTTGRRWLATRRPAAAPGAGALPDTRSAEHTSALQSLIRTSPAVFF